MTKSRMTPWLPLLVLASPAGAQPVDVGGLVAAQRETLRSAMRLDCPQARADEEIVVCGSSDPGREHRLPLPVAREPRAGDRAAGEQRAALDIDSSRCTPVGQAQQCSGGLDVIGIAVTMARALGQALADED